MHANGKMTAIEMPPLTTAPPPTASRAPTRHVVLRAARSIAAILLTGGNTDAAGFAAVLAGSD